MRPELAAFLQAAELDDAQAMAQRLKTVAGDEIDEIARQLARWTDRQAVANLLMHPDLIPDAVRYEALRRGLRERAVRYWIVAACVGCQTADMALSGEQRAAVAQDLLGLIGRERGLVAARASAALIRFASAALVPQILNALDHPEEATRHNVRAALIRAAGPRAVRGVVAEAVRQGRLPAGVGEEFERRLAHIDESIADDVDYRLQWLASGLTTPLLAYVPNLQAAHGV